MKKKPLVSIIIPAYNAENYLEPCVKSVLKQTYKNLDIIIVNDGSRDSTLSIAESFAKKHKNVSVITKKNGGLGYARNTGLEHAKGEFIYYLDSDDMITEHCIERLVDAAIKNNSDVVCTMVTPDLKKEKLGKKNYTISGIEALCESLRMQIPTSSWGRLYRKEAADKEKFTNIRYAEDFEYNLRFFPIVDRVTVLDDYTYIYVTTPGSMVNSPYDDKKAEIFPIISRLELMSKNKKYSREERSSMKAGCYLHSLSTLIKIYETGIKKFRKDYIKFKKMAKRNCFATFKNKKIDNQHRRFALCSMLSIRFTLWMIVRTYRKNYGK